MKKGFLLLPLTMLLFSLPALADTDTDTTQDTDTTSDTGSITIEEMTLAVLGGINEKSIVII